MSPIDEGEDVYAAPETNVAILLYCPKCGGEMEEGFIRSSSRIMWAGESQSGIKKALFGGEPIAKVTTGIGCKHRANYCGVCRLFMLQE